MNIIKNILITYFVAAFVNVALAHTVSLEDKLEKQFELYEQLRHETVSSLASNSTSVPYTKLEWELALTPPRDFQLQAADFQQLRSYHAQITENARIQAEKDSVLDLALLRENHRLLRQFALELPKGGMLHVHPYGTVDRTTANALLRKFDPLLDGQEFLNAVSNDDILLYNKEFRFLQTLIPAKRFSELSSADKETFINLIFLPNNPRFDHPFERFSASFIFLRSFIKAAPEGKKMVIEEFLSRAYAEGVRYVELTDGLGSDPDTIKKYDDWSKEFFKTTGVIVRWNASFQRGNDPAKNAKHIQQWLEITSKKRLESIVGIDLLGNERNAPAFPSGYLVYVPVNAAITGLHPQGYSTHLKRTMHAGEIGHVHNVRDSLILGTDRIGHGVQLANDIVTLEYARRKQLPIEINLVSNLKLQSIRDYAEHPFLHYLRLGMPVSLSTDDEGILETSISNEFATAIENTDITYAELKQLAYNSITTSFASEDIKQQLLADLDERFKAFEEKWGDVLGQDSVCCNSGKYVANN